MATGNLNQETRKVVIQQVADLLEKNYVLPEIGKQMAAHLQKQWEQGVYEPFSTPAKLSEEITISLLEISSDFHLACYHHPQQAAAIEARKKTTPTDEPNTHWWEQSHVENFGLQKVEILTGNVGYLKILRFAPVSLGGDRMAAAMAFLSDCDGLIFDLRECGGGDPYMVQFLESYLFTAKPKLLLTLYDRPKNETEEIWTLPHVPGKRMPEVPVVILTSDYTFSGGEDFAYTMKHHRRASIIGEVTGGGGHTIEFMTVGEGFVLVVPTGQPIHPQTSGNWEGVGVQPDILVSKEKALQAGHLHALETLLAACEDDQATLAMQGLIERVSAVYEPYRITEAQLEKYIGTYSKYQVSLEGGILSIRGAGHGENWKMTPIADARFIVDDEYNASFELDENGQVTALVWLHVETGQEIRNEKVPDDD